MLRCTEMYISTENTCMKLTLSSVIDEIQLDSTNTVFKYGVRGVE